MMVLPPSSMYPMENTLLRLLISVIKPSRLDFGNGSKPAELTAKLQSGSNSLQSILVMGDRLKGQAKALNQQSNTDNITNIISADQIGRFPDANIGDAIKRVPGITMQNDQGEARNIVVRGMGPEFNSRYLQR